jgi:hypothetical protein
MRGGVLAESNVSSEMSQNVTKEDLQGELFLATEIRDVVLGVLATHQQPSAWDLLGIIEERLGWKARWLIKRVLEEMTAAPTPKVGWRTYLKSLTTSSDLETALAGGEAPRKEIVSTIDRLVHRSKAYKHTPQFQEMISFMARFREYAPYNNMLVRIQNPTCSFYATLPDWEVRFARRLKEDAHPMLILAPMHPVMLVYALDATDGPDLPSELTNFAHFQGTWDPSWLQHTIYNAAIRDLIRVDFKTLSSTNAGFATVDRGGGGWKMRICIHTELDEPSRYGTLCHELAHIYLGHLGPDREHWWPSRTDLDLRTVEIEAEATAFIVTTHLGLEGASPAYVSRYLGDKALPASVSLDQVAKVAGRIEQMASRKFQPRKKNTKEGANGGETP